MYLSICLGINIFIYLFVYLSNYVSIYLSINLSIHLSISIYLLNYLSIYPSIYYLFTYLPIYLSSYLLCNFEFKEERERCCIFIYIEMYVCPFSGCCSCLSIYVLFYCLFKLLCENIFDVYVTNLKQAVK